MLSSRTTLLLCVLIAIIRYNYLEQDRYSIRSALGRELGLWFEPPHFFRVGTYRPDWMTDECRKKGGVDIGEEMLRGNGTGACVVIPGRPWTTVSVTCLIADARLCNQLKEACFFSDFWCDAPPITKLKVVVRDRWNEELCWKCTEFWKQSYFTCLEFAGHSIAHMEFGSLLVANAILTTCIDPFFLLFVSLAAAVEFIEYVIGERRAYFAKRQAI